MEAEKRRNMLSLPNAITKAPREDLSLAFATPPSTHFCLRPFAATSRAMGGGDAEMHNGSEF